MEASHGCLCHIANPYASTWPWGEIKTYAPEYPDIQALTCAIFEKLSTRSTVAGDVGVSAAAVEIRFSLESLRKFLGGRNFNAGSGNLSGCLPVDFPCWRWELDPCFTSLGIFTDRLWYRRNFDTPTYCEVDPNKMMKLSWRYKSLVGYSHSNCARCIHRGSEEHRPQTCEPTEMVVRNGPPWIKPTFSRRRGNRIAVRHQCIIIQYMSLT